MLNTRDKNILKSLKTDFKILTEGLKGAKNPFMVSFDAVSGYVEQLKGVIKKIQKGVIAKDDFCYYTMQFEEIPEVFALESEEKPVESMSQKSFNLFVRDCSMLEQGIEGLELNQIDFDKILDMMDRLEVEIKEIKQGISPKDNFMAYGPGVDMSGMFAKKQKR